MGVAVPCAGIAGVFVGVNFGAGVSGVGRGTDAGENQHRVFGAELGFGVLDNRRVILGSF